MSLLKMKIIVLLEKLKKVTAVAEELGMKQPTVSFHMRRLEEEWGVPLFEMKTGKVMLTEAGRLLHHYAEQIDRTYTEAQNRFNSHKESGRHPFVIGCIDAAATILFQDHWFVQVSEIADRQFTFITGTSTELFDKLQNGSVDLIITGTLPVQAVQAAFQQKLLLESPLSLYMPDQHALAQSSIVPSYRLAGIPFMLLNETSLQETIKLWEISERVTLQTQWSTDRAQLALNAVQSGLCMTILPSHTRSHSLEGVKVIPLPGQAHTWQLYSTWRSDYWNPSLMQRMLQLLQENKKQIIRN
ncbi:LysR family transcriptional regulator [Paenibacillus baekrokdamisoli]|uniref:LysR family transcriptional regulator n=1 Tax=Paenibacillus baekrokdamisoli TaxID=1712516 RepID=A0A3G9J5H4_9BACL|nr:LysR family transcriptional regulator [Paenibacillus baekrokdamisoli]MBB3072674.1 DNA-binding transcriptional LysR family regulator [Paenibacillus baekrokdamisoli]BBH18958.1 LysR family transcriptional regulator [Paenibacillus baekrokdamisoli]